MKKKQNFRNIVEMLKTKNKISLSNGAVQKYLPIAHVEIDNLVYAWQKNYSQNLQKSDLKTIK